MAQTPSPQKPYKRILLKISGEALMGRQNFGISAEVLTRLSEEISEIAKLGIQIGVVIGGGNFFRGKTLSNEVIDRITGDHMGMLATVMNVLALRDALDSADIPNRVMSAIPISGIVEHYDRRKAVEHLKHGRVVFFAAGTGNPLVTTDSAASLRAIEISADLLIKATNVDGVYSADPVKHPKAERYKRISYQEALEKEYGIMDLTAFCQCRDHNMKIRVFNMNKAGALLRVVMGEDEGTLIEK